MNFYMLVLTVDEKDYFLYENNQFVGSLVLENLNAQIEKFNKFSNIESISVEKFDDNTLIQLIGEEPYTLIDFIDEGNSWKGFLIYE
jgi:hypothetical protein